MRDGRVTLYGIPWEARGEIGVLAAWFRTAGLLITQPVEFYRKLDPHGPIGSAVLFAAISALGLALVYVVLIGLIVVLVGIAMMASTGSIDAEGVLIALFMAAFCAILPPMMLLFGGFIWGFIHHVIMILVGGGQRGVGASVRVALFASPIQILQFVPCLNYIAWAWYLPVMGIGYTQVHAQDGWRSAMGVLLPFGACCMCCLAYYALIFAVEIM
jgi:hypothetical protein